MNDDLLLSDWLDQEPLPHEVKENEDGSKYIPIEFIKPKLDFLSTNWSTKNFLHHYTDMPVFDREGNNIGRTLWASGSVELIIEYYILKEGTKTAEHYLRTVSGSATFDVQKYYPNTNWAQTLLSLSIVAAAKELGRYFGKELNKEVLTMPTDNKPNNKNKSSSKITNTISSAINKISK